MSTKAGKVSQHATISPVMLVFILLSLLSHLLILVALTHSTATPQSDERWQDRDFLSVRIHRPEPRPPPGTDLQELPHPEPKTATDHRMDTAITLPPDIRNKPRQFLKQPQPAIHDARRHKITAVELMKKAFDAVPAIAQAMEGKDSLIGETVIFDLRLRKKLDNSPAKRPEIEVISDYGDYFSVRINGRCWKIPVPDESDPFDTRIVMRDFRCK